MAHYRAQMAFQYDTAFPRDAITINPHFNGDNAQGLADALKTNLLAAAVVGLNTPFTIKIYDAEKSPPSYPLARAENIATPKVTNNPREIALCLSYYSTFNRPGYRGRLYIPSYWITGTLGLRPTASQITQVLNMQAIFHTGLPAQHTWEVWSPTTKQGHTISNVWVDDEWDTVRSRGMKATTRQTASAFP